MYSRIVHRLIAEVIDELDIEGKTIGVSPVGCATTTMSILIVI